LKAGVNALLGTLHMLLQLVKALVEVNFIFLLVAGFLLGW
jgi:hypothetical protein